MSTPTPAPIDRELTESEILDEMYLQLRTRRRYQAKEQDAHTKRNLARNKQHLEALVNQLLEAWEWYE